MNYSVKLKDDTKSAVAESIALSSIKLFNWNVNSTYTHVDILHLHKVYLKKVEMNCLLDIGLFCQLCACVLC
jgi:hypothetical protein